MASVAPLAASYISAMTWPSSSAESGAEGAKTARVVYTDPNLSTTYPPHRPEGIGGTDVTAEQIYLKTIDEFTTDLTLRFVRHSGE